MFFLFYFNSSSFFFFPLYLLEDAFPSRHSYSCSPSDGARLPAQQCLIYSPSGLCRRRADMCFLLLVIPMENNTRTAGALDTHLKTYSEIIFLAYASWLR